jgi:phage host-nuclease inhibitor protein Gam
MNRPRPAYRLMCEAAMEALGDEGARRLVDFILGAVGNTADPPPRRARRQEVEAFLAGGAFAEFLRDRVVRDACYRLAQLPQPEQEVALRVASLQSVGSINEAIKEVVRYMSTR